MHVNASTLGSASVHSNASMHVNASTLDSASVNNNVSMHVNASTQRNASMHENTSTLQRFSFRILPGGVHVIKIKDAIFILPWFQSFERYMPYFTNSRSLMPYYDMNTENAPALRALHSEGCGLLYSSSQDVGQQNLEDGNDRNAPTLEQRDAPEALICSFKQFKFVVFLLIFELRILQRRE